MVVRQQNTIRPKSPKGVHLVIGGAIVLVLGLGGLWLASPGLTYKGVPLPIIMEFIQDPIARGAFLRGKSGILHRRLGDMGVEEKIKNFYRPQIPDEQELDLYIHQLLYDNTGYLGVDYLVGAEGKLVLKPTLPRGFWRWFGLARKLQLVSDHVTENGVLYIITPEGTRVDYKTISSLYSLTDLQKWTSTQGTP